MLFKLLWQHLAREPRKMIFSSRSVWARLGAGLSTVPAHTLPSWEELEQQGVRTHCSKLCKDLTSPGEKQHPRGGRGDQEEVPLSPHCWTCPWGAETVTGKDWAPWVSPQHGDTALGPSQWGACALSFLFSALLMFVHLLYLCVCILLCSAFHFYRLLLCIYFYRLLLCVWWGGFL